MSCGTCQLPLRVCVCPGFPGLRVPFLASLSASLCCSESEDFEIRICEFIPATACVLLRVSFSFEFISRFDALHTVLNSGFVRTLPIEQASPAQQNLFFSAVMTPTLLPVRPGLH